MSNPHVILYVEGPTDKTVVQTILQRAEFPVERLKIEVCNGKKKMARIIARKSDSDVERHVALIDLDANTAFDAVNLAREQLQNPNIAVFCAVPTLEAWLLADPSALEKLIGQHKRKLIKRLPLPEQIPYPKYVLLKLLGKWHEVSQLAELIDLKTASLRAPSLRLFLEGMAAFFQTSYQDAGESYAGGIDRNIFSNLMSEVVPADAVVFRTLEGTKHTAAEMIKRIRDGDEIGKQYCSDVLRVARGLLIRKSQG